MSKELMLKVYDIDYSFILKNYLDEKLWEKKWTLFVYKGFVITLRLKTIEVDTKRIWFEIRIDDNNPENPNPYGKFTYSTIYYYMQTDNLDILKKKINTAILERIERLEAEYYIQESDRYIELRNKENEEIEKLKQIASDFLDSENVTNEEIRKVYIEYFVDENEKMWNLKNEYENSMKYQMLTDFYFIFLKSINDEGRIEFIKTRLDDIKIEEVEKEIDEYIKYIETQEFEEEMQSNLEEI